MLLANAAIALPKQFQHITAAVLRKADNHYLLTDEVEILNVLPLLLRNNVISHQEGDKILEQQHRRRKVAELLQILDSKDNDRWVQSFLNALDTTGQRHIINRIKKITDPPAPYRIRRPRPTQFQKRVLLYEDDDEDLIRRKYNSEKMKTARNIFDCDIVNVYKGSICFLLNPKSYKAVEDLWNKTTNRQTITSFLFNLLNEQEIKERFTKRRFITVELTEMPNEFIFNIAESVAPGEILRLHRQEDICSGCFRQTVIDNYFNIVDEIETMMMEQTFSENKHLVPACIEKACLREKIERSREERADIFLQFILSHEQLLLDFRKVFMNLSNMVLNNVLCEKHSGQIQQKFQMREKVVLHFEVYYDTKVDTLVVTTASERISAMMKPFTDIPSPEKSYDVVKVLSAIEGNTDKGSAKNEKDNFNRLNVFLFDVASDVVRTYFQVHALRGEGLDLFLNMYKHDLFHLITPVACCCCYGNAYQNQNQRKVLSMDQFRMLFDKTCSAKHKSKSVCLCMFSAKTDISTSNLDFSLMYTILKNVCPYLNNDDEKAVEAITEIRNKIVDPNVSKSVGDNDFNVHWVSLENSVSKLAANVDADFELKIKAEIRYLRQRRLLSDDSLKPYRLFHDWWVYNNTKSEKNQVRRISLVDDSIGKYYWNMETLEEKMVMEEARFILVGDNNYVKRIVCNMLLNNTCYDETLRRGCYYDNSVDKKIVVSCVPEIIFDDTNQFSFNRGLENSIKSVSPGPHCIIIALNNSLLLHGKNLDEIPKTLSRLFGKEILRYTAVVVHGYIQFPKEPLLQIFQSYPIIQNLVLNNRVFYMNNNTRTQLVVKLLRLIGESKQMYGREYFVNQTITRIENEIASKSVALDHLCMQEYRRLEREKATLKSKSTFLEILQQKIINCNNREVAIRMTLSE